MKEIYIQVVENGYVLRPNSFLANNPTITVEEVYVFNTLRQAFEWLDEKLETPKEGIPTPVGEL